MKKIFLSAIFMALLSNISAALAYNQTYPMPNPNPVGQALDDFCRESMQTEMIRMCLFGGTVTNVFGYPVPPLYNQIYCSATITCYGIGAVDNNSSI